MRATAPIAKGAAMDETIDYERRPPSGSGYDSARASAEGTQGHAGPGGRFTFGSGARPLEGYTIKRAIGRGGFGEVYYAVTDAGKEVALKLITRDLDIERRGVLQCMNLKSQHLITIHDLRTTEEGDTFVIMEYVSGPSLACVLDKNPNGLPADEVRVWLRGLVEGVSYLHDHGIVHRDLKPANLFLEEGVVKIGDYGLSKSIAQTKEPGHSRSVGTCHYMAPEIGTGKYHKPIDIYAIGVILYEMLTGKVPFDGESVHEVLMKHLTSRPDLSMLQEPYKSIVGRALAKDPNQRPARAIELLPPGEAPRAPDMRFIHENARSAAGSAQGGVGAREELRIGGEEEVIYIGPDTVPPRGPDVRRAAGAARKSFWGVMSACAPRQARGAAWRVKAAAAGPAAPPPEPPAIPAPRARVAELATSMLLATGVSMLSTVLSVPLFGAMHGRLPEDPTQLAMVFLTVLLGSWAVMIPSKLWEGREVAVSTKRLIFLVCGMIVGGSAAGLSMWGHLGIPGTVVEGPAREILDSVGREAQPDAFLLSTMGGYFGLAFALNRFDKLTARGREARFRLGPVIGASILAAIVGFFIPSKQPWGLLVVGLVALVVQFSSPWSREAAAYARYQQALGKRKTA